jgi:DNA processing protein
VSVDACSECLRRSALVGFLSARLTAVLGGLDRRPTGVLSLGEEELIAAVAGSRADAARAFLDRFERGATLAAIAEVGQGAACRHGPAYPRPLLDLADPPAVLYHTGRPERLERLGASPAVAVVGTRRPSRYATEVARALGRGLAAAGVTVVSGLALGIDGDAHRGALEAAPHVEAGEALAGAGIPVAVLAGGADVPYPRTHARLYERVREVGAVVSELPPGTPPVRWSFPARNRIMAGLAGLTVVVEAAESSGSLVTAEFALQMGRELGAVPGQVTARRAEGGNRLLREGAAVIRSAQDALDEVLGIGAGGPAFPRAPERLDEHPVDGDDERRSVTRDAGARRQKGERHPDASGGSGRGRRSVPIPPEAAWGLPAPPARPPADRDLAPNLLRVLELVEAQEGVEAIAREAGLSPGRTRAALGRLELMGLVARDGLSGYVRLPGAGLPGGPILGNAPDAGPRGGPPPEATAA